MTPTLQSEQIDISTETHFTAQSGRPNCSTFTAWSWQHCSTFPLKTSFVVKCGIRLCRNFKQTVKVSSVHEANESTVCVAAVKQYKVSAGVSLGSLRFLEAAAYKAQCSQLSEKLTGLTRGAARCCFSHTSIQLIFLCAENIQRVVTVDCLSASRSENVSCVSVFLSSSGQTGLSQGQPAARNVWGIFLGTGISRIFSRN